MNVRNAFLSTGARVDIAALRPSDPTEINHDMDALDAYLLTVDTPERLVRRNAASTHSISNQVRSEIDTVLGRGLPEDIQAALGTLLSLSESIAHREGDLQTSAYAGEIRSIATTLENQLVPNKQMRVLARNGAARKASANTDGLSHGDPFASAAPVCKRGSVWLHEQVIEQLVTDLQRNVSMIGAVIHDARDDIQRTFALPSYARVFPAIANLLDIADSECGRLVARPTDCWLDDIFAQTVANHAVRAENAGSALSYLPSRTVLRADRRLFDRALACVIDFALEHATRGSAIVLAARALDRSHEVSISIAGLQIGANAEKSFFDKHTSRSRASQSERHLALYFCRRALEAQGGKVTVECGNDQAVLFRVILPRAAGTKEFPTCPLLLRKRAA